MLERLEMPIGGGTMVYRYRPGFEDRWVIFLHGAGMSHRCFQGQLDTFGAEWNLLLPDLRGSGETALKGSNCPVFSDILVDIVELAKRYEAKQVTLIGHSFGAAVAQEITYQYPDLVSKLILIGSHNHHRQFAASNTDDRVRVVLTRAFIMLLPWRLLASSFARMSTHDKALRQLIKRDLVISGARNWAAQGITSFKAMHQVQEYEHPKPTLLIRGGNDHPKVLGPIYEQMKKVNPSTDIRVVPETGHHCFQEEPEQINKIILDWLDR